MIHAPTVERRRKFMRPAASLMAALDAGRAQSAPVRLPGMSWNECTELVELYDKVRERGWNTAAEHVRRRLASSLETLFHEVRQSMKHCADQSAVAARPSLRSVVDDLGALEGEFDEVEFDLRTRELAVVTDPIELEEVALGRFRIRLRWRRLGESRPYVIEALDPNPAATDSGVTHPHVHDEALCEGDGKAAIRAALEEGRFFDFFLLVRQILETYNSSSAYVRLSEWAGVSCTDCGSTTDRDEACYCERCESDLCNDCASCCGDCGRTSCSDCRTFCQGCDDFYCRGCLNACDACGESFCSQCLTDGLCETCRENLEEPDDDLEPEASETTAPDATDAEVCADGVGEVGLPA
jgi:hypothetical protein